MHSRFYEFCGYFLNFKYDKTGFWITDKKEFRTTTIIAFNKVVSLDGCVMHRIVLGRFLFEWARIDQERWIGNKEKI